MAAQSRINGCLLLPEGGFPVWGNNSNLITWIRSKWVIDQKRPYQVNKAIDLDKDTSPQRCLVVVTVWFKLAHPFFSRRPSRLCCLAGWAQVNFGVQHWFSCSGINELWSKSHNGADGHPNFQAVAASVYKPWAALRRWFLSCYDTERHKPTCWGLKSLIALCFEGPLCHYYFFF